MTSGGGEPRPVDDTYAAGDVATAELFAGAGEMRTLARRLDWGATPLGRVDGWSPALRKGCLNAIVLSFFILCDRRVVPNIAPAPASTPPAESP